MKKTDKDYIILRSIVSVYVRFYKQYEDISNGYDDEGETKDIIEAVQGTYKLVEYIKSESFKLLGLDLVENMKELVKELEDKEVI